MTTAIEKPSRAAVDHFTQVYRLHLPGIRAFVGQRLVWRDEPLAEDITAEAFTEYWRRIVLPGRCDLADTSVFNLLATIARRRAWNYYNRTRSVRDTPVDFEDTSGIRFDAMTATSLDASADPEQIARDLDDALDAMNAAGKAWRKKRQSVTGIKAGAASVRSRCSADRAAQFADSIADRLATAEAAEQRAIEDFCAARAKVARLRDLLYPTPTDRPSPTPKKKEPHHRVRKAHRPDKGSAAHRDAV